MGFAVQDFVVDSGIVVVVFVFATDVMIAVVDEVGFAYYARFDADWDDY